MPTPADRKLATSLKTWRRVCPEDPLDVVDIRRALAASAKLKKLLAKAKFEIRSAGSDSSTYQDFDESQVDTLFRQVEDYVDELQEQQKEFAQLKKWLSKVRTSAAALPCSLVVKGNDQGSLHVHKAEGSVNRSARSGKSDLTGSKVHPGTCRYEGGKLVFTFDGTARAPWRTLLQRIIGKAGLNMKVALAGMKDADDASADP